MVGFAILEASQTINPTDNNGDNFTRKEIRDGNRIFLNVETVTLDGSTSATFTAQSSFDGLTWIDVKLLSTPATNWSHAYTGDVSTTQQLFIYDTADNVLIPFVAPFFRFVVTLAGFTGSPVITCSQGASNR